MFDAAVQGLLHLGNFYVILAMLAGISIGTFTAVAPQGLGTPVMYALLIPVIVKWDDPIAAIAILIAMDAVSSICAAYLPVLFGIPGGAGSQATVLDGYPMGRRGEARRALGASFMAGMLGSLIGTVTLALAVPVAKPLINLLGSPELFVVVLWGLAMVSLLAGRKPIRGLIAAGFGLLLSSIGMQPQTGVMRYVFFDNPYFMDGFPLSVVALALFGIPAALDLALTKVGVEQEPAPLAGKLWDGVKDTLREWWLVLRCSFLGVWVGIVPGIGAQTVDWLAYGHAAQTCKGAKATFGKGDVRGVIAPESANDAKDGGDLLTTLLLGFPQGVTTALFIAALLAMGFVPGPDMVNKNLDVIFTVIWILGLSGIIGSLVGFGLANPLAKLAQVRYSIMVPVILTFILMGALSADRDALDLLMVVLFGGLGYFMKRFSYPRPPLILGMLLGDLLEKYLYISTASYGYTWLARPGVIILFVLTVGSLALTLWGQREKKPDAGAKAAGRKIAWRLEPATFLTVLFLAAFVAAILMGREWTFVAQLMPLYVVAVPGVILALIQIYRDVAGSEISEEGEGGIELEEGSRTGLDRSVELRRTLGFFAWFAGAAVAIWLLGITIALPIFVLLYCLVEGREKWWIAIVLAAGAYAFLWGLFEAFFKVIWPSGYLFL
jgi:TctA family transporter